VTLADGSKMPYDVLVIACGEQDQRAARLHQQME
jgi:NADH dehydrogenase FAD-containing subunit